MLGRRLDRYVTSFFVWHFLLSLVAILGLYVIIDTFAKLDSFVEHEGLWAKFAWIIKYHVYQVPVLLCQFLPVVTLLAGIISLSRLARYNELNAMKAAGVSIHRTLAPVLLVSLVIGGLGAANQELLVPGLERNIRLVRLEALKAQDDYRNLFVSDTNNRAIWVEHLDTAASGLSLTRIEATPRASTNPGELSASPAFRAAKAIWVKRWLFLSDGVTVNPNGTSTPFANRILQMDAQAKDYELPPAPPARLADGTAAYAAVAQLDGHPLDLAFATCKPQSQLKVLSGGQITQALKDERTPAPVDVRVALWQGRQWLGKAQSYVQASPIKRELILYDGDPIPLSLSPEELIQNKTDPTLRSFRALRELARNVPALRRKIAIVLQNRIAFPFASFVLLLVAIPFLFQQEGGKGTWLGAGLAMFVSICFYFLSYACQVFGQHPAGFLASVPGLAAWLPVLIFAGAGAVLLWNMDS